MGANPGIIPISSVINVAVNFASAGIPNYNVNNIGLFTTDSFLSNPNTDLYRIYNTAAQVGTDFGTTTETYLQALNIFAQSPNILNGYGQLIIIPIQTGAISTVGVTAAGTGYKVGDVLAVANGTAGSVTVATVGGYGNVLTVNLTVPGFGYTVSAGNATTGGFGTACTINITGTATETLIQAIARGNTYLYYGGILSTSYGSNSTWAALAASVQALGNQILFLPSNSISDIYGAFNTIATAIDYFTRCLYYGGTAQQARLFAAAYAGKLLATNYSGSATSINMNFQQLTNVVPDTTLTTTLLAALAASGVDAYGNYGGSYPGVVESGGVNKYADEVANLVWLVTQLQVAGFNALATAGTKVTQTEGGMNILKAAYRLVLQQAVSNRYLAPGTWTSADTFGNQQKFLQNIASFGFYIYSSPVSAQTTAQRTARQAPLIQIACKEAGAIDSSNILVTINQ